MSFVFTLFSRSTFRIDAIGESLIGSLVKSSLMFEIRSRRFRNSKLSWIIGITIVSILITSCIELLTQVYSILVIEISLLLETHTFDLKRTRSLHGGSTNTFRILFIKIIWTILSVQVFLNAIEHLSYSPTIS